MYKFKITCVFLGHFLPGRTWGISNPLLVISNKISGSASMAFRYAKGEFALLSLIWKLIDATNDIKCDND